MGYINRAFWTKEETGLLQTDPLSAFAPLFRFHGLMVR